MELKSIKEVCQLYSIDRKTLYRWQKKYDLKVYGIRGDLRYNLGQIKQKVDSKKVKFIECDACGELFSKKEIIGHRCSIDDVVLVCKECFKKWYTFEQ